MEVYKSEASRGHSQQFFVCCKVLLQRVSICL